MEKVWTDFPFWLITAIIGGLFTIVGLLIRSMVKRFFKGVELAMEANTLALDGVRVQPTLQVLYYLMEKWT